MQSFKLFWRLIKARKTQILVLLAIYFVLSLGFFLYNRQPATNFKPKKVKVGLVTTKDMQVALGYSVKQTGKAISDKQAFAQAFLQYLAQGNELIPLANAESEIRQALYYAKVEVVLRLPDGFIASYLDPTAKKLALELRAKDAQEAYRLLESRARAFLQNWQILQLADSMQAKSRPTPALATQTVQAKLEELKTILASTITLGRVVTKEQGVLNAIAGQSLPILSYIFAMVFISVVAGNFHIMNQRNLRQRDAIANVKPRHKLFSTYLAASLFGCAYWFVFVLFIHCLYGHFAQDQLVLALLYAASLLNMLCLMAFALFIAELNTKPGITQLLSTSLGIFIAMASGIFLPIELVPKTLQTLVSLVSPIWNINLNGLLLSFASWDSSQRTRALHYVLVQLLLLVTYLVLSLLLRYYRTHRKIRS